MAAFLVACQARFERPRSSIVEIAATRVTPIAVLEEGGLPNALFRFYNRGGRSFKTRLAGNKEGGHLLAAAAAMLGQLRRSVLFAKGFH